MQMKAEVERWNFFYLTVSVFFFCPYSTSNVYIEGGIKIACVFVTLQSLGNKYSRITTADTLPQVFAHLFMQLHTL